MGRSLPRQVSRVITKDYDRVSQVWDRTFVPATDVIRRALLDAADLRPGERVLDVGTGTGAAALLAASRVGKTGRVLGIDRSAAMLAKARAKASQSGLTNVTFRRMDGAKPTLPSASFDAIISSFGTPEGLYDGEAVFRAWLRILRPGGRLCFAENPGITPFFRVQTRILEKHKVEDPGPALAARRRLWEQVRERARHERLIEGDEPKAVVRLMKGAGFRDVRTTFRRSAVVMPSGPTMLRLLLSWGIAEEYGDMRPADRAAFRREFLQALRRYQTPTGLRIPARTNFFFGRRSKGPR